MYGWTGSIGTIAVRMFCELRTVTNVADENTGTLTASYLGTYLSPGLRASTAPGTNGASATNSVGNVSLAWGHVFTDEGELVVSVVQEGLVRTMPRAGGAS